PSSIQLTAGTSNVAFEKSEGSVRPLSGTVNGTAALSCGACAYAALPSMRENDTTDSFFKNVINLFTCQNVRTTGTSQYSLSENNPAHRKPAAWLCHDRLITDAP